MLVSPHNTVYIYSTMNEELKPKEKPTLENLIKRDDIWLASKIDRDIVKGIPTTYPLLDQHLYGSGLPREGLTELLLSKLGIGEMRLLTPALAKLSQEQNRWLLWVSPPYIPYAPALAMAGIDLDKILIVKTTTLANTLWVIEKALASKSCSAVLAWPDYQLSSSNNSLKRKEDNLLKEKQLRRLQVASKEGQSLGVLFRNNDAAKNSSPAELRMQLQAQSPVSEHSRIKLKILKRKGGWPTDTLSIELNDYLNLITPNFSELKIDKRTHNHPEEKKNSSSFIDIEKSKFLNGHL
ncbi:MAG: cell division inhibitor SulA [Candidatus Azotimanducaceae bacterium]|jgi:cell division inhibitor SulA